MGSLNAVRSCLHEITDMEVNVTERHDRYINIFTYGVSEFERDQMRRELTDSGFDVYPVTKDGVTRKLLVGTTDVEND